MNVKLLFDVLGRYYKVLHVSLQSDFSEAKRQEVEGEESNGAADAEGEVDGEEEEPEDEKEVDGEAEEGGEADN